MTRNGKIARLPRQLREIINQRLENNEPAEPILAWLNPLPEVQAILKDQFESVPVSKQNLYEWRKGGYHEWEFRRDFDYDAAESRADGRHLEDLTDDCLADSLGVIITARYNSLVRSWLGDEPTDEFKAKLKVMRVLVQDVSQMRRWDHSAHKVALANAKYEDQKYYAHQAEMEKLQKKVNQQKDFIAFLQELAAAKKAREAAQSTPASTSSTPSTPPTHRSGDSLSPHPEPTTAPSPNHPPHSSHSHPQTTPAEKSPAAPSTTAPVSSFFIPPSSFQSDPVKPSKTTFTTPPPSTDPAKQTCHQPLTENQPATASSIPGTGDSPSPQPEASPASLHNSPASHPPQPRSEVRPRTVETLQKGILAVMTDPNGPEVPGGLLWGKGLPRELRPYQPTMCQGKCELYQGQCTGCHRTEDQIAKWPLLTPENRLGVWKMILERRRARQV